jgi:hypothetical protein
MLTSVLLDERIIPQPAFGTLLSIQFTVLNNQGNDYRVARPRGVLATTSSPNTLNSSPRRLSTWDGGQSNDISRPPLHAGERQWWRIEPSLVIWLRLTPHAGELRGSVFSGIHDRRLQRSSPLTCVDLKALPTGNHSDRMNKAMTTRMPLGNVDRKSDNIAGEWR